MTTTMISQKQRHLRVQQILAVYEASCALGIFMYSRYARFFHLPRVLTVESSKLLAAGHAPIRKLCPEYWPGSTPAFSSASLTAATRRCLVRGLPSTNLNRGPALLPLHHHVGQHGSHWTEIRCHPANKNGNPLSERVCLWGFYANFYSWRVGRIVNHHISPWQVTWGVITIICWHCQFPDLHKAKVCQTACRPKHHHICLVCTRIPHTFYLAKQVRCNRPTLTFCYPCHALSTLHTPQDVV